MSWQRAERLNALIKEKVAVVVTQRLADPRLGFVTITEAKLSPDKRRCTVKYTVLGSDADRRKTGHALKDAAPHILEIIGPSLRIRRLPELVFEYDGGVEKGSRMLDLLDRLAGERGDRPEPTGEPEDA